MRRIILGVLLAAFLWSPAAFPKDREWTEPLPLFMHPEFHFSQVQTVCLAPALDLRADKTRPLYLSQGPGVHFEHIESANQNAAHTFKFLGYQTAQCNPVSATLSDLKTPSDAWLRTLDFGPSSWLLILAVDDVQEPPRTLLSGWAGTFAVVSGFLFEKRADSVRLVWRDRAMGTSMVTGGRKGTEERAQTALSVNAAADHLVGEFGGRPKGHPLFWFAVHEENFAATCDAVWPALSDAVNTKGTTKIQVRYTDASDRMALYIVTHRGGMFAPVENETHVALKPQGSACTMQVTQSAESTLKQSEDWSDLIQRTRALLPKQ